MTLRKRCEEYLYAAPHVAPLTIEQQELWLENTGINPMRPSSSNPTPPSSPGSGSSSPNVINTRVKVAPLKGSAYNCGNPGGKSSFLSGNLTLPSCSWDSAVLASGITQTRLKYVSAGGNDCSSSTCNQPEVCGYNTVNAANPTCGTLMGYWTADQVCSVTPSLSDLKCNLLWDLYACNNGLASCYSQGATTGCCGCADWWTASVLNLNTPNAIPYNNSPAGTYAYPVGTTQCVNYNPVWTKNVLPKIKPLKQICPTMYTYPFDDMTSTFVCNNGDNPAPLNYFITFCPDENRPTAPIVGNSNSRTVVMINKCPFDIWPAVAGGAVFTKSTIKTANGHNDCTQGGQAACVSGSTCVTIDTITGAKGCFWINPSPVGNTFKLSAWSGAGTPQNSTYHFNITSDTQSGLTTLVWSGVITARTECPTNGASQCKTSDCGQDPSSGKYGENCKPGVGFVQPTLQAEFSFQTAPVDFYDIEAINGIVGFWNGTALNLVGIEILPNVTLV